MTSAQLGGLPITARPQPVGLPSHGAPVTFQLYECPLLVSARISRLHSRRLTIHGSERKCPPSVGDASGEPHSDLRVEPPEPIATPRSSVVMRLRAARYRKPQAAEYLSPSCLDRLRQL
jgi:hypothetical protein